MGINILFNENGFLNYLNQNYQLTRVGGNQFKQEI